MHRFYKSGPGNWRNTLETMNNSAMCCFLVILILQMFGDPPKDLEYSCEKSACDVSQQSSGNPSFPSPGFHNDWPLLNVLYQQVLNIQSPAPPIWSFMVVWHFEPFISMLASALTVNSTLFSSFHTFFPHNVCHFSGYGILFWFC